MKKASVKLFKWFHENGMKANQDKCHFLSSVDTSKVLTTYLHTRKLRFSRKLLGVTIDKILNFNEHFTNLCDKASRKIQVLAKLFPYIHQTQEPFMNAYFMSRFGYFSLVWMKHSRTLNNRINGLHKRALSIQRRLIKFFRTLKKG